MAGTEDSLFSRVKAQQRRREEKGHDSRHYIREYPPKCTYCKSYLHFELRDLKKPVPKGAKDLGLTVQSWVGFCPKCGLTWTYEFDPRPYDKAIFDIHVCHGRGCTQLVSKDPKKVAKFPDEVVVARVMHEDHYHHDYAHPTRLTLYYCGGCHRVAQMEKLRSGLSCVILSILGVAGLFAFAIWLLEQVT